MSVAGRGPRRPGAVAAGTEGVGRSRVVQASRKYGAGETEPARQRWARALLVMLPFLVMAVVVAVDVLAGPGVGFLPALALSPVLAAVSLRPAQTALVGGLALVVCVPLAAYDDLLGSQRGVIALATIAGVTAAGVIASTERHRRELELADMRAVAEVAQRVLLRPVPREMSGVAMAVRYISAAASARIGGDLYEVIALAGDARLIVGDVQGQGLAAVQTAATVLGAFRAAAYDASDLVEIAARIELSLKRQAGEEEFVTAVLAQIRAGGSRIEILNCGHPPPLLISGPAGRFIEPQDVGLPLGLGQLTTASRDLDIVALCPGDQMLFYTDGISEARDRSGDFYPVGRCWALLHDWDPDAALDRLRDDVLRHVGHPLHDDAAMLLVSRRPQPEGSDARRGVRTGERSARKQHGLCG